MDTALISAALEAKLTANEWKVLAAMALGHLEVYDIQQVTGLQKVRVEAAVQNAQVLHNRFNTNTITLVPVQNAQTPPMQLLLYLNQLLVVHTNNPGRDLKAMKTCYLEAYKFTKQSQAEAIQLVKDCMDVYPDDLKRANYPAPYLITLFKAYLRILPPKPKDRREWEAFSGKHTRFNPKTKLWEAV